MRDVTRVLAGDCTVRFEGADGREDDVREERGAVVVVEKPDGTVLVHDRDGYRPVAWLTRADAVSWPAPDRLDAVGEDKRLSVTCHTEYGHGNYRTTRTGVPAGECPDCGGALVHERGAVPCLDCEAAYSIPRDAELTGESCADCGLPRMRIERGAVFETCVDPVCESLDDAVRERFDRAWSCPACGGDLLVLRRGGLIAGCEGYPACEASYGLPAGSLDGECGCGLPAFEVSGERRCLDPACDVVRS